jgi:hypothetical protein
MDWRTRRINQEIQRLDRRLMADRRADGTIQIIRQADRMEASDYNLSAPHLASLCPQFVIALTDTWNLHGKAVEWGLEPIVEQLKSMDSWRNDKILSELRAKRERAQADQARIQRNENRARAIDSRKDFARATNEINTSALEKVDNRRKQDGNYK